MGVIRKILNPELFQCGLGRRAAFEGWYFKLISADRCTAAAVIPGVSLGASPEDSHAFVQFILGRRAEYYRFPLSAFRSDSREFALDIGGNAFSLRGVSLRLGQGDNRLEGELAFSDMLPFPKRIFWPGIMGPFGYVPGMECYHAVVSVRHGLAGSLRFAGEELRFGGGSGYVEKDWGRSFPSSWIWVQANHFASDGAFLFSVADIPWLGGSFKGFFSFLHVNGRMHLFATYTGAKLLELAERGGATEIAIESGGRTLQVSARPGPCGLLKAPKNGLMDRLIEETIAATVSVSLTDRRSGVLFEGDSPCAGMERYDEEKLLFTGGNGGYIHMKGR